ncbi:hypothetical protein BSU04_22830 [Caballeronia sordidicola]|uniref:Uncharacterized protein n=1 Tax=Caballeronia sordidicola TaxID=196367 RepID=A0A226WYH7_CABSO|nr:hypothetical protein BSU04_22830 [Caballeronia sordidicola]
MISVGFERSSGATYADWRFYFEIGDNFIAEVASMRERPERSYEAVTGEHRTAEV